MKNKVLVQYGLYRELCQLSTQQDTHMFRPWMQRVWKRRERRERERANESAEAYAISSSAKTFAESGTSECLVAGSSGAYQLAALYQRFPRSAVARFYNFLAGQSRGTMRRSSNGPRCSVLLPVIYPRVARRMKRKPRERDVLASQTRANDENCRGVIGRSTTVCPGHTRAPYLKPNIEIRIEEKTTGSLFTDSPTPLFPSLFHFKFQMVSLCASHRRAPVSLKDTRYSLRWIDLEIRW